MSTIGTNQLDEDEDDSCALVAPSLFLCQLDGVCQVLRLRGRGGREDSSVSSFLFSKKRGLFTRLVY